MSGQNIINYDDAYAQRAKMATEGEKLRSGVFLSTRGGILSLGEEQLPGNQACVIILDWVRENTLYSDKYDADNPLPPICYAFARGPAEEAEMGPHPSMQEDLNYFQPQSSQCHGCQWNEWGSADKGRGKACQNRRRLTMINAGVFMPKRGSRDFDLEVYDDPGHYEAAEPALLKLPVTSVESWAKYVNQVGTAVNRSPDGVFTRIFIEPHPKWQYTINFELVEKVPPELAAIIMRRADMAQQAEMQGYMPPEAKPPAPQAPSGMRSFRRSGR